MTKMSAEQQAYVAAKERYEQLNAEFTARRDAELDPAMMDTDDGMLRYCELETALEFEVGSAQAYTALIAAEKVLLSWAHQQVKRIQQYRGRSAEVDEMFEYGVLDLKHRDELLSLAIRTPA